MTLSPSHRAAALKRLRGGDPVDVLVVGGGVVGCGVALDAASRGLSVGLIEARDFASGTSSRSSKLIHGGLRYLEMFDFALVHEALQERGTLLNVIAPHLVKPVPFLYPLTRTGWERLYVGSGIALYDGLALGVGHSAGVPRHRHLSKRKALSVMPSLRPDALTGAVQYYDAQVEDARFVLELARTATRLGAHCVSRVKMTGVLQEGEDSRVVGVTARDDETGDEFSMHARHVISAAGVWTNRVADLVAGGSPISVTASKGVHLVVPREKISSETAVIVRTEKSVLLIVPWDDHWLIGTTDTAWDYSLAHPAATQADIDYLLGLVNKVLVTPLTVNDIDGVFTGLRPLVTPTETDDAESATTKISREHVVVGLAPGMVAVAGGKYTTYRVMAKDAVDQAYANDDEEIARSETDKLPLLGARGLSDLLEAPEKIAAAAGLDVTAARRLIDRYGSLVHELIPLMATDPTLRDELPGSEGHLNVEIVYAVAAEGALHLTDVLTRRTRVSIEARDRGVTAAAPAAALMAQVLGWDRGRIDHEIEVYLRRVEAEMTSQTMPDDASADAARSAAPDANL